MAKAGIKHKDYKKPPIKEAVIEVRFTDSLSNAALEKLVLKLKSKFSVQKMEEFGIKISHEQKSGVKTEPLKTRLIGYKLIENADSTNVVLLKHDAFSISQLAPYRGWAEFLENFKKYHDIYTHKQHKKISRIGVRFINRIDIPASGNKIELEDYFNVFPTLPKKDFPDFNRYVVQTTSLLDTEKLLTINAYSYNEDTPLIDHCSIVLDIDIGQINNLPQNSTKLYQVLEELREKKNFFFEKLIKPQSRRLFK
jgi:uncharacterized protein (TIGR04255 family)